MDAPPASSRDGHSTAGRSGRWLDLLLFFLADAQTGFGPFLAVYLTEAKWTQVEIGFALTVGTVAGLLSQLPGGAFVDAIPAKRAIAMVGVALIGGSALLLAVLPTTLPVYVAQILHGLASCVVNPAIAAISLAVAGYAGFGERLGRNARFASIGNGLAAGVMGVIGTYVSGAAVFWLTAALTVPALFALSMLGLAPSDDPRVSAQPFTWAGIRDLLSDRRVLVFGACVFLFHLANAAMLPLAGGAIAERAGAVASLIIAACIVVPQAVVAAVSPTVGRLADRWGRRPILLIGWGALPLRGILMAPIPEPYLLIGIQALSGISGAVFGVLLPLVAADLTRGSGRFNLCLGGFGLASTAGAAVSTTLAGWLANTFNESAAFIGLAAAGLAGTILVRIALPETRPSASAS